MTPGQASIAVLDDEPKFRQALGRLLRSHGLNVQPFETGTQLLDAVKTQRFDCVLIDLQMPEVSGFDVLRGIGQQQAHAPVIVITGHDEPGNAERVYALGAANYMLKPVNELCLLDAISRAVPALQLSANSNR